VTTIDVDALERDPNWTEFIGWARRLGGGFHPDNRAENYEAPLDDPIGYDRAMAAAFAAGSPDPYEVALTVVPVLERSSKLRRLVFTALANAATNGYELEPTDEAEAIDLMDTDANVEAYVERWFNVDTRDGIDAVTALVAEWRAGARF